jgi:DnaJ-related protein SCJ1
MAGRGPGRPPADPRPPAQHLDGHVFTVQRRGVTQPGTVVELPDEGMPKHEYPSEHGALFVELTVVFPAALGAAAEEQLRAALAP